MSETNEQEKLEIKDAFIAACTDGNLAKVKDILTSKNYIPDVDVSQAKNLAIVLSRGHTQMAQFLTSSPLLAQHSNPFLNDGFPLIVALERGHKDFIKWYLESQFYYSKDCKAIGKTSNTKTVEKNVCNKLLLLAIKLGDREMADYLLSSPLIKTHANCNKNFYYVFLECIRSMLASRHAPMFDLILDKSNSHPIDLAKHYPSIEISIFEMLYTPDVPNAIISAFAKTDNWPSIERLYSYLHLSGRGPVLDALIAPYKEKRELSKSLPFINTQSSNKLKL